MKSRSTQKAQTHDTPKKHYIKETFQRRCFVIRILVPDASSTPMSVHTTQLSKSSTNTCKIWSNTSTSMQSKHFQQNNIRSLLESLKFYQNVSADLIQIGLVGRFTSAVYYYGNQSFLKISLRCISLASALRA